MLYNISVSPRAKRSYLYNVYHQGPCNTGKSKLVCLRYIIVTRHMLHHKGCLIFLAMNLDFALGVLKTISSFLNFFVMKKISKTIFKLNNFQNFESPAINDLDCIMTLESLENISCNGWLVVWVHDWPLIQGTGVQISLEPNFFPLY